MTDPRAAAPELKILRESDLEEKACVVIGTRPGIVMFSPVIRELQRRGTAFFILHTGQHYSHNMDQQFLDELDLPVPDHRLDGVSREKLHGAQTAQMLKGCEEVFVAERPRLVLVGGDANTNLAGALAARKLHIQVAHLEAGERSYDWRMPEEHNRVLIDHMCEYLFTTNSKAVDNLREDSVRGRIVVTGNPIVDATRENLQLAEERSGILTELGLARGDYLVATVHREENVDSEESLRGIVDGMEVLSRAKVRSRIVFAAHPRTRNRLEQFGLSERVRAIEGLVMTEAVGYLAFLKLVANAALVLTDSGGVQQETCILRVPCVTLRENTEWTETLELGANVLAGTNPDRIVAAARQMVDAPRTWENPFGDGSASRRIVDAVEDALTGSVAAGTGATAGGVPR